MSPKGTTRSFEPLPKTRTNPCSKSTCCKVRPQISLARNPGGADSAEGKEDAKVEQLTADVLGWSGGRYLVGAIGIVVVGIGVAFAWKGIGGSFAKQVENRRVGPFSWRLIHALGVAGWVQWGALLAAGILSPLLSASALMSGRSLPTFLEFLGPRPGRTSSRRLVLLGLVLMVTTVIACETALGFVFDPRYRDFPFAALTMAVVPFWMLMALAVVFLAGCASGVILMWLSMLGPLGPGHGPAPGVD